MPAALGLGLGLPYGGSAVSYSPEATAAFAAMSTQPSAPLKALYDACIVSLKSAGVWTKLDALYLMNAETAQAARVNIKNPGTYDLTATSSPTFTAKVGYAGDGAAAYLDTNFNPTTAPAPQIAQNSASVFAWGLTNVDSGAMFGQLLSSTTYLFPRLTGTVAARAFSAGELSPASVDSTGLWSMGRVDGVNHTIYRNGSSYGTAASASAAPGNSNFTLLTRATSFSSIGIAMAGFGSGLSAGENTSLYNALNTFKTGVSAL